MNGETPRPVALRVEPNNIPFELRGKPQWVLWRYTLAKDKWSKVPYMTNGGLASSTVPQTWATFESALDAYRAGHADGIGFVHLPGDKLVGIGLDHVRDQDGAIQGWALDIIALCK